MIRPELKALYKKAVIEPGKGYGSSFQRRMVGELCTEIEILVGENMRLEHDAIYHHEYGNASCTQGSPDDWHRRAKKALEE